MATKQMPVKSGRDSVSVDFPRDLWAKLGVIAEHNRMSKLESIVAFVGPSILKAWRKAVDEMSRELGENGGA